MSDEYAKHTFAGIGGVSGRSDVPSYIRTRFDTAPAAATVLKDVVNNLQDNYGIEARRVAYDEPDTEAEWTATPRHIALVNPANGHLWHIPTNKYEPVGPMDKFGPLLATLRKREQDVLGQFRLFRDGGEVHADLLFDGIRAGEDDNIVMGVQTGYDYYGGVALYAEIIAYDTDGNRMMRNLSDRRTRRHTGSAGGDVAEWWEAILAQCETAADGLAQRILEAQEYVVDFDELPFTPEDYLKAAFDGTEYLGERAAERMPVTARPDESYTAHELYKGMADTLTHDFEGKPDSSAVRKYVRAANKQLFAPPRKEDSVLETIKASIEGQEDLEGEPMLAAIEARQQDIGEAADNARSAKEQMKRLVRNAETAEGGA